MFGRWPIRWIWQWAPSRSACVYISVYIYIYLDYCVVYCVCSCVCIRRSYRRDDSPLCEWCRPNLPNKDTVKKTYYSKMDTHGIRKKKKKNHQGKGCERPPTRVGNTMNLCHHTVGTFLKQPNFEPFFETACDLVATPTPHTHTYLPLKKGRGDEDTNKRHLETD